MKVFVNSGSIIANVEKNRKTVKINAKGVILSQDGTHLGRLSDGTGIEAQIIRDSATMEIKPFVIGPSASARDVLSQFSDLDELPLVWQTDNASIYLEGRVQSFLEHKKIIHLVSRPGKPTDNAIIERGMREIKRYVSLGKGIVIKQVKNAAVLLASSIENLNSFHKRSSRRNMTSVQYKKSLNHWSELVTREEFYEGTKKLLAFTTQKDETLASIRQRQRCVIYNQLMRYGLVTLTQGGVPIRW